MVAPVITSPSVECFCFCLCIRRISENIVSEFLYLLGGWDVNSNRWLVLWWCRSHYGYRNC